MKWKLFSRIPFPVLFWVRINQKRKTDNIWKEKWSSGQYSLKVIMMRCGARQMPPKTHGHLAGDAEKWWLRGDTAFHRPPCVHFGGWKFSASETDRLVTLSLILQLPSWIFTSPILSTIVWCLITLINLFSNSVDLLSLLNPDWDTSRIILECWCSQPDYRATGYFGVWERGLFLSVSLSPPALYTTKWPIKAFHKMKTDLPMTKSSSNSEINLSFQSHTCNCTFVGTFSIRQLMVL